MVDALANFAYSTVFLAPFPPTTGTNLTIQAGDINKFPVAPFNIVVWPSGEQPLSSNAEIMRVTSISNNTFTVTRAQENTTNKAISVGYQVAQNITAGLLNTVFSGTVSSTGGTISGSLTVTNTLTTSGLTVGGNATISGNLTVSGALSSSSFVDPINYGADPTGRTDSTAAIQAAIFSGIPVRFSPGIYVVSSPLYLPSGAKLEGTGMNLNAIYTSHPLPKETAAIYHANVSYNSTTGSTTYSAPGAGPLFVIHPPNQNITIKDIVLYGAYTTSADNYAIYAVDVPGEGTTRNYSTSQPWQAYNAANWVTSMPSVTTGALTAGTTVITGLSPSDTTFLQPGMSLALYSSSPSVYEEVTVKSYSSGTLTLTLPIKNKYTSSSTILKPFLANMNLRLENVAANYFSGDATIYLGHNRGENKLEHVNIYGAGISGGSGNNANACGIVWNCADSEAKNSVIGACALHGFVLNDTVTAVNGGEIWNCGGNGVYVLGGLQCTIGTRTTFDHHKKEAIYIEAGSNTINNSAAGPGAYFSSLTGTPGCSDVTIEPGVSFSNNCTSFSGTQNAITSNIATDTAWTGRLNVLGNIVLGNLNGTAGVQYHVYLGNSLASLNYTDNLPINNPTTATTYSVVSASDSTITLSGSTAGIVPYVPLTIGSEKKIVDVSYTLNSTTVPLSTTLTGTYSGTTMAAAVGLPYFNGAVYYSSYSPYGIANTGTGSLTKAGSPNVKTNSDDSNILWYRQISNGNTSTPVMKFQSSTTNSDQLIIQAYDSTSPAAYSSALYTQSLRLGTSSSYDANIVRTASGVLTVQNNLIVTSGLTVSGSSVVNNTTTTSALTVTNGSALYNGIYTTGYFNAQGAGGFQGSLSLYGGLSVNNGNLTIQSGNLTVNNNTTTSGLTVNGPLNINTAVLGGITATSGQAAVFNGTSWVPSTISGTTTTSNPLAYGNPNVGESFSRFMATTANTVVSGNMRFAGMYLASGQVVRNITFATTTVSSTGLTSSWGGIFTTSGTSTTMYLLASTSGQVNPTYAASSIITTALSGTFTVPSNGIYLVGFTFFGTTPPGWVGTGNGGNGSLGAQLPVIMAQTSMAGYPTPPPIGTSFSVGGSSYSPWFALT